ncbi:MAG: type I-G CRISPR-associated protein Csb2, partial [Longimicrobiales bacterium]
MSIVISLRFPAGRYHATPWDRHANEAAVEWPPSPWRILRSLIAAWHRKVSPERFPEEGLAGLVEQLSLSLPAYNLPRIVRAHTRHYMPVREGSADRPVLIFDAFARVDAGDELIVAWTDIALDDRERELLSVLVRAMGYLGRAESWVDANVFDGYDGGFDCVPSSTLSPGERAGQATVNVLAAMTTAEYAAWRERMIGELGLTASRLTKAQRRTLAMLPPRLLDALRVETGDLRTEGWNLPPGGRMVTYLVPRLESSVGGLRHRAGRSRNITTARIALAGRPLPRIEDAVRIGELVRAAAIRAADRAGNGDGVPSEISGHGSGDELNHQHAFYLPEDADGDGFIDHVLIHAPGGLSRVAIKALDDLHRRGLWTHDGEEWAVVFEGAWDAPIAAGSNYCQLAQKWVSITPYLHPWYSKPNFGVTEQVRRECAERGLPAPVAIGILPSVRIAGRERRAVHFHRFRSKRGLRQPDNRGSIIEITFPAAVSGPLALGFGCHYGLGLF